MVVGDLLTTKEAAEVLRVSHWTVSAWLSQGKLQRTKVGSRTMIRECDLQSFINRCNPPTAVEELIESGTTPATLR